MSRESWLETELYSLRLANKVGDFTRRSWHDRRETDRKWWDSLPEWFTRPATRYVDPKWKPPKPKQPHPQITEILKAIEEASDNEQSS